MQHVIHVIQQIISPRYAGKVEEGMPKKEKKGQWRKRKNTTSKNTSATWTLSHVCTGRTISHRSCCKFFYNILIAVTNLECIPQSLVQKMDVDSIICYSNFKTKVM